MKKTILVFSIIAIAAMLFTACATAAPATEAPAAEAPAAEAPAAEAPATKVVIGYGAPELSGAQGQIMQGLIDHSEAKGWEVTTTNADGDTEAQANQIDDFIAMGVNAIVTVPVDSQAICASVTKAHEAGIPFYTIDRGTIGCKADMTIQSDNYMAGKQAAEALVAFLTEKYGEPKGVVLELQGDLGQNVAQLRGGGFNDFLKDYPNIEVVSKPTEWAADKFSSATLDVLGSRDDVDGIYMHSDSVGTTVVLAALEQLGKKFQRGEAGHVFLCGVDGSPDALQAIRDGWSDQASSQPIPDFGIIADWIEKKLAGEDPTVGEVVQEGALWSPATISETDSGFVCNLATTSVTPENADSKALWGNN